MEKVDKRVLTETVAHTVQGVEGVASLVRIFGSNVKRLFCKKYKDGIKIENVDGKSNIDVYISVKYGYNVTEVSANIQYAIKQNLEPLKSFKLGKINVNVLDVVF
ncbi:MAG: Asp23/Gls24 family envelope stress response protein [Firmicutes bacterium]|nr:Asp23/Gls24 family envelope stress response protein [Bacillota bacterium]